MRRNVNSIAILIAAILLCGKAAAIEPESLWDVIRSSPDIVRWGEFDIVRVKDGDTIVVNVGGIQRTVRLIPVDAPEMDTPEGKAAKEFVSDSVHLAGRRAELYRDKRKVDRYGRDLAYIILTNPRGEKYALSEQLIRTGNAKHKDYDMAHDRKVAAYAEKISGAKEDARQLELAGNRNPYAHTAEECWVIASGETEVYHTKKNCRAIQSSAVIGTTIQDAKARGLRKCKRCEKGN